MKTIQISKLKPKTIGIKKFKHKKGIAIILILLIVGGIIVHSISKPSVSVVSDYTELSKDDLCNSINTVGTVESNAKVNVYSTLNNTIKEVKVEAGDSVNEGDVLCILDSSTLEREIKETGELINVDKSKAQINMDNKKNAYDNMSYIYDNNINSEIKDSEEAFNSAKIKLEDAMRNYEKKKALFNNGAATQSELDEAKVQLDTAQSDYDKSQVDAENAKVKAQQDVENAKKEYESAVADYNDNKNEITLQGKKDDLSKCVITAPASGTITTVNAAVGNQANGILFVIEDLSDPVIKADIKEVDINRVQSGQDVEVSTDASADDEYAPGKILSIADTINDSNNIVNTNSNNTGSSGNNSSSSSTFEAKIKLDNPTESDFIKVGMKARAKIILDKREDVFAVPFSSIIEEDGTKYIYILRDNGDGQTYTVSKIEVATGMETDISVEIESDELNEGDKILTDTTSHGDGEIVQLMPNNEENSNE